MITDKTILIIGAGSNKVYGFPTGTELRRYIIKEFEKDLNSIWDEIDPPQNPEKGQFLIFSSHPQINSRKKQGYLKIAQKFIERFNASSNLSIDLFIARNPDFAEVGKLSIIMKLLKAEFKSKFREDLDRANQNQDWYIHIFKKLSEGLTHSESYINFKKNDISFIGLGSNIGHRLFVGWVEIPISFVGFRSSTQPTIQPFLCY